MSAISDIFGGGSSNGQTTGYVGTYVPQNASTADQDWLNALSAIQGNNSQISNAAQGVVNNPYAAPAQTAANNAGAASTAVGNADIANAGTLSTAGNALIPYATQALDQGFDPNSALYNQNLSNLTNLINAQNSQSGIGTSPVGANIANNDIGNFLINWNAQKLANQNTAANTANTISSTAGNDLTGASNLGTQGVTAINAGGALPYANYIGNLSNIINALNSSNNANQLVTGDTQSYLNGTTAASSAANNAASQNFADTNTAATGLGGLFSALPSMSSLSSLFSGGSSSSGTPVSLSGIGSDALNTAGSTASDPSTWESILSALSLA